MKTWVCILAVILVATLAVAAEKEGPESNWQWNEDEKPLADLGQDYNVNAMIACHDGTMIVACYDKVVGKLLMIGPGGERPFEVPAGSSQKGFKDLALSPDGKVVYALDTHAFQVFAWTVADRKLFSSQPVKTDVTAMTITTMSESMSDVAVSGNGIPLLAFAERSNSKSYAPVTNYSPVARIAGDTQTAEVELRGHIRDLAFAPASKPEDRYLAVAVWDYRGKAPGHYGPYWLCVIGPKAELLARHKLTDAPYDVAISPKDPSKVAVATFSGLVVMDARTGKTVSLGPRDTTGDVHFLSDGALFATSGQGVRLWDISKKKVLATLGKKGPIAGVIASNAYGTELYVAYGGRIYRFKRQRPEGEPVPVSGK